MAATWVAKIVCVYGAGLVCQPLDACRVGHETLQHGLIAHQLRRTAWVDARRSVSTTTASSALAICIDARQRNNEFVSAELGSP